MTSTLNCGSKRRYVEEIISKFNIFKTAFLYILTYGFFFLSLSLSLSLQSVRLGDEKQNILSCSMNLRERAIYKYLHYSKTEIQMVLT